MMELLRSFTMHVELFAGTDIDNAASDMCALANRVGVMIEADFNGVKLWASTGDDPKKLVEAFHIQLDSKFTHRIAQARDVE